MLSPQATCGTASSSTSTAVYSECADETGVFIGPLGKPQDWMVCGPSVIQNPPPPIRWMNVQFAEARLDRKTYEDKVHKHADYTQTPYDMKLVTGIVN